MYDLLIEQKKEAEGVTEELKEQNQQERIVNLLMAWIKNELKNDKEKLK